MTASTRPAAPAEGAPATWRAEAVEAGRRRPFADIHQHPPGRWQRDFAIFGGVTTLLATGGVFAIIEEPVFFAFTLGAAIAATAGGAVTGRLWHDFVHEHLKNAGVARAAFAAALMGAFWGTLAAVAGGAALASVDGGPPTDLILVLGAIGGGIAGALQCAWFAPAYALSAARGRLLGLSVVVSPFLGWIAIAFFVAGVAAFIN